MKDEKEKDQLTNELAELRLRLAEARGSLAEARGSLAETRGSLAEARGRIAELEASEAERKRAEERFRLAAEVASDLIYEWDVLTDRLEWFGDIDRVLGYEPDEFPRSIEAWAKIIHPDDQAQLAGSVERHRRATEPIYEEYQIQRQDGEWLYWTDRGVPVLDSKGRPYKWIGVCTDITEQKRAEQALKEYSERLEEMVEQRTAELRESEGKSMAQYKGIPVPTYTWQKVGEDLVLVDYNGAAVAITQGRIADFVGITVSEMYRDLPEIQDEIERCFAAKTTIERNMPYEYMSIGGSKYLAVKYAFVPPDLVLVHTEDITKRVRAEEEPQKHREHLEELVEERTAELKKKTEDLERSNADLQRFNRLAVGRELRMIELKREINALAEELGREPPYDVSFAKESGVGDRETHHALRFTQYALRTGQETTRCKRRTSPENRP